MPRSLGVLTLCIVLTACVTAPVPTDQAELEVRQASDQFFAARQQRDAASFTAQFTEDGVFMVPGLLDATGTAAIRDLATKHFAGGRTESFEVQRREIRVIGDTAHELGWFTETNRRGDDAYRFQGRHVIVWQRGAGGMWRVHRYLYSFADAKPIA